MSWFEKDVNFDDIPNMECDYYETAKGKWAKLDSEKLKYLIEESRIFLQTLWDGYGRLTQKVVFLLGYVVALLGYIFTKLIFNPEIENSMLWYEKLAIFIYIMILVYIFLNLIKYQLPVISAASGTQPKDIFKKDTMNCDFEEIAVEQIMNYQKRIHYNRNISINLSNKIKYYFWVMLLYPIVVIFAFRFL